jgi:lysophospholipase L1-like esterase
LKLFKGCGFLMKKMADKKFLTIFLVVMFILVSSINISNVKAEETSSVSQTTTCTSYVALGDSISYGMSADPKKGYVDLFGNHLGTICNYGKVDLKQLSIVGDKTNNLLDRLQTTEYQNAVKNAQVITISIGGNNLLSPIISNVCQAFGVNPGDSNYASELALAMSKNPRKNAILAELMTSSTLKQALSEGVLKFSSDFPQIIQTIKTLSPQSEIYVLTLYNPFDAKDPLYFAFDPVINSINAVIKSQTNAYKVADVYEKFKTTSGSVNFSLSKMMLDPHPTTIGHAAIYQSIIDVETKNSQAVASDKKWTVTFTGEVGYDDLTKNAIVVTDSKGEKVDITSDPGTDGKSIIINPPTTGYVSEESYTLTVGKQAHNKNGKQMKQDKVLNFTIK